MGDFVLYGRGDRLYGIVYKVFTNIVVNSIPQLCGRAHLRKAHYRFVLTSWNSIKQMGKHPFDLSLTMNNRHRQNNGRLITECPCLPCGPAGLCPLKYKASSATVDTVIVTFYNVALSLFLCFWISVMPRISNII